jgi:Zn-dependent M16 (insulinase) family peptidase
MRFGKMPGNHQSQVGAAAVLVLLLAASSAAQLLSTPKPERGPATFSDVTERTAAHGFRAAAVYLNDADQPFGARFVHQKTGFTLDLIQLQSVPQAFAWVNSFPVSDKGEPHTQEHLLMGKGNVGRAFAASQTMTLTEATAFTKQWRTCYNFDTRAGLPVFYDEFQLELQALLHPDYTDEEIRREVRNFGVSENPTSHDLRLEEKGTVYNEMVSSMNNPGWALFRQFGLDLYGPRHPLAYNAGGEPSGIRELVPADIRKFHRQHYYLANMGAVVSLPKQQTVDEQLARFDQILNAVQPLPDHRKSESEDSLPRPQPAPAGSIQIVDFPFENENQPSYIGLAWPATRKLNQRDAMLMQLFLDSFAGDTSTDLYRLFINSKTRKMDLGAESVFSYLSEDHGFPVMIGLDQVAAPNLTEAKTKEIRGIVTSELARIAALPDDSPELAEFNALVRGRLIEQKRQLSKFVNTPPNFGSRNGGSNWMDQLYELNREPGFRRSVTQKPDIEAIGRLLDQKRNIWRDLLPQWHLTDTEPYGIVAHPSAALLKQHQEEALQRAAAEAKRLQGKYRVAGEQSAIRSYKKDYDAESAKLDEEASKAAARKFLDNPPMTLDEQLEYKQASLGGMVPYVFSVFDNMTSATAGLALNLASVPESDLVLVSLLPALMTQTGVIENGKPVPYEEMQERLRKDVLGLNAGFSTSLRTNRVELVLRGSGNDLAESRRAVDWMRLVLDHPDWRRENLPRIRDLVEHTVARLRETMQEPEETWVMNPVLAYWKQQNPLYLTTSSFLTRAYNADRLRWMLRDMAPGEDRAAVAAQVAALDSRAGDRAQMNALLSRLQSGTGTLKDVAADLAQMLPDIPDATLLSDWRFLCQQISRDLLVTPEKTLARLEALRESLLLPGHARLWAVGSRENLDHLGGQLNSLAGANGMLGMPNYDGRRRIDRRLEDHQGDAATPRFVGLFDSNMSGGVMATIVPSVSYDDLDRDSQLDYLASRLFAGYGAHGIFTKTIGAGLAYSNGLRGSIREGYSGYYAERMPEIPQTLHFAIDVVKKGPRDPKLLEYVTAIAFQDSNAAESYEDRAEAIADELADGVTPEKVRKFREALLSIRREPGAAGEIFQRVDRVYGRMLPGYGPKAKDTPGAVYFIIGNEKQFAAMDSDVQVREDEHVYRLYPRDYWLIP